jgi:hypothetical protein
MWYPHICHIITYVTIESILADDISSGKLRWMHGKDEKKGDEPMRILSFSVRLQPLEMHKTKTASSQP